MEACRTTIKFKHPYLTEYRWYVFDDIYVDLSDAFGIFDILDNIYYDTFDDTSDDISWYIWWKKR